MENIEDILKNIHRGCTVRSSRGLKLVTADFFGGLSGVEHGFSTRVGGVSPAPFDSLNMSLTRPDNRANVMRNYGIFCEAFGLDRGSLVLVNHEHGANVVRVDRGDLTRGLDREPLEFCDGIITDDPLVTLVTLHADCSAVYLYDEAHRAIGLCHAGWKGTFKRVGQRMAEKMGVEFGTRPEALKAVIGPRICFDCFEVDASIGDDFAREFAFNGIQKSGRPGKAYVDIEAALMIQLLDAGVKSENISAMGLCTYERRDLFFSYRRDRTETGAMIGFLRLKGGA